MKKLSIRVNTTRGTFTDQSGQPFDGLAVVYGDDVLISAIFEEEDPSTGEMRALALNGYTALRCMVKSARTSSANEWTYQYSYNSGVYPAGEDLANGKVTWVVTFTGTTLNTAIGSNESASGYVEFAAVDASSHNETLLQAAITIYQQLDDGTTGSPPPASPTYLTAAEIALAYVAKALFDANTILAANTDDTPAAVTVGEETLVGRITGGNITALSAAQVRTLLSVSTSADTLLKSLFTDAKQILYSTAAATPAAVTITDESLVGRTNAGAVGPIAVAEARLVGRITGGHLGALDAATVRTLLAVETAANSLLKSLFTAAHQLLYSTAASTPAALTLSEEQILARLTGGAPAGVTMAVETVLARLTGGSIAGLALAEQTMLGRITGGSVAALSAAQVRTLLAVETAANTILKSVLTDAQQVLYSTAAGTPAAATITDESIVARIGGGNVGPVAVAAERIVGRKATGSLGALTATEVKTLLGLVGTYRTLWVPAAAMIAAATDGALAWEIEYATNKQNIDVFRFDDATEQAVWFTWTLPLECDPSHIKAKFFWLTSEGLSAETVCWGISARAYTDDDAADQAMGSEVTVSDTFLAQGDVHISTASGNITPAGTAAAGKMVTFRIARKVGSDDLTGNADLVGILMQYKEADSAPAAW